MKYPVNSQVRLLDVENSLPSIEALVDKGSKVLGQAQLPESRLKILSHPGGFGSQNGLTPRWVLFSRNFSRCRRNQHQPRLTNFQCQAN